MSDPVANGIARRPEAGHLAESRRRRAAIVSVAVGCFMLLGKWLAYALTGSSAILSDALESVVHVAATGFALYSLIVSARPPDEKYPYGYGKIGYFSAGFEGALIVVAALTIGHAAIQGLLRGEQPRQLGLGLMLIFVASLVNLGLGGWLIREGKRTRSIILEADGHHVLTDAITSFGVVLGVALVLLTGWYWLDSVIALLVAVNIIVTGLRLTRHAFLGLMDRADNGLLEQFVAALNNGRQAGWIDLHNLRAWQSGDRTFVDFHLVVPPGWTVEQLHEAHIHARNLISSVAPGPVESVIHFDPDRPDRPVDPNAPWTLASATRTPRHDPAAGHPDPSA
ncbi:MAG: cation diffusion facilitator transporter [Isosphaeraceae bacterium]|jgi:cation diffusion facilitator family transporter|nr:MAG: cation diffusion facilitator transporter [Isosphaeraceae bacterium]